MNQSIKLDHADVSANFNDRQRKFDLNEAIFTEYDGVSGVRTFAHFEGDELVTQTVQDASWILESNYEARKNADENWKSNEDFKFVASIPLAMWLQWEKLGITQDGKALLKAIEMNKEVKRTNRRL